jgi:hypothetical protein
LPERLSEQLSDRHALGREKQSAKNLAGIKAAARTAPAALHDTAMLLIDVNNVAVDLHQSLQI